LVALFWRATKKENPINPAWPAEAIQAKAAKSCLKKMPAIGNLIHFTFWPKYLKQIT